MELAGSRRFAIEKRIKGHNVDQHEFLLRIEEALRASPGSVTMDAAIDHLEGWDSIGALSVIAVVDEHYGLTLDAGALMGCKTVRDLAALVEKG